MLITKSVFLIVFGVSVAIKPPGYIEKPKVYDANPPKYKYEYSVQNTHQKNNGNENNSQPDGQKNLDGGSQGHTEIRDGDNTKGNYYVNLPSGQAHADVQYIADDWGYHPIFRYATHDDHSTVTGHFALGHSAVELLNKNSNVPIVGVESVPNTPEEPPILTTQPPPAVTTHTSPRALVPTNNGTDDLSSPNSLPHNDEQYKQPNGHGQPQRITLFDVDPHARDPEQYDLNIDQPQEQSPILQYEHQKVEPLQQQVQPQYNPQAQFINPYQKHIQYFLQPQHQPLLVYHDHPENLQLIELPIQHQQPQQYLIPTNMQITTLMQPIYGHESPKYANNHVPLINNDPVYNQNPEVQSPEISNNQQQSNNPGIKKLVASTKDLVTGKDVLDINLAAVEEQKNQLFQPAKTLEDQHNAASNGQKEAVELENQQQEQQQRENHFTSPIVVTDEPPPLSPGYATTTTEYTPHEISIKPLDYHQSQLNLLENKQKSKQINVQIVDINNGQYLKETSLTTNIEAPSRIFLKNFKSKLSESPIQQTEQQIYSTTGSTTETTSAKSIDFVASPTPILPKFQTLILNTEVKKNADCVHGLTLAPYATTSSPLSPPSPPSPTTISYQNSEYNGDKTFVEVQKSVNIKNVLFKEKESYASTAQFPEFGARLHYTSNTRTEHSPVHVEKQIIHKHSQIDEIIQPPCPDEPKELEKPIEQSVQVEQQVLVHANYVNQPHIVETVAENPVEEQSSDSKVPCPLPLENKNNDRPYTIKKVIEKIVDQPIPIGQIIEKEIKVPYRVEKVVTVEKIIEKPVPFPYPVHVNSNTNRPYPVNGIDEPYTVVKNVDHLVDEKNVDSPIQVQVPVAVHLPYGVPIHVPYTIEKEIKIPYHIPYIQSYPPPPPLPHHYQHHYIHPTQQQQQHHHHHHHHHSKHSPTKHVFLQPPSLHSPHFTTNQLTNHHQGNSLFSLQHLQSGNYDKKHIFLNPQISSQLQKSTILHSVPTSYVYPKPVYGVPYLEGNGGDGGVGGGGGGGRGTDAIWGQNIKTKLFTNTDQLQTYAGKYDYQHNLYKDDYHGPPPSQHQQQNLWLYHANQNHLDPLESSESIGLKLVATANNKNNNNNIQQQLYQPQFVVQPNRYSHSLQQNLPQFKQKQQLISNHFSDYRRSLNFGKHLRWEYGFKPPLIPSIEIDDHGNPIKRTTDQ